MMLITFDDFLYMFFMQLCVFCIVFRQYDRDVTTFEVSYLPHGKCSYCESFCEI